MLSFLTISLDQFLSSQSVHLTLCVIGSNNPFGSFRSFTSCFFWREGGIEVLCILQSERSHSLGHLTAFLRDGMPPQHKEHFWFIHTSGMEEAILESEKEDTCRLHWSVDVQWDERGFPLFLCFLWGYAIEMWGLQRGNESQKRAGWPYRCWVWSWFHCFFGRLKGLKRHMNLVFHGWTSAQAKKKLLIFELTFVA